MKTTKLFQVLIASAFITLGSVMIGCGADVDIDTDDDHCPAGYFWSESARDCCPVDHCCGTGCDNSCDSCN